MKKLLAPVLLTALSAVVLTLTGCGESQAGPAPRVERAPAALYKAGHGVQLAPAARAFVGLRTADVSTHRFGEGAEVAAVPVDALLRTVKGDFVYVANGDYFLRTPVLLGRTDASHAEIKEGLYEGDTLVIAGVRALALAEIQALNGGIGCADGH